MKKNLIITFVLVFSFFLFYLINDKLTGNAALKNNFEISKVFVEQMVQVIILLIVFNSIILVVFRKNVFSKDDYNEVREAVKISKEQGFNEDEIKQELLNKGWDNKQINEIIKK